MSSLSNIPCLERSILSFNNANQQHIQIPGFTTNIPAQEFILPDLNSSLDVKITVTKDLNLPEEKMMPFIKVRVEFNTTDFPDSASAMSSSVKEGNIFERSYRYDKLVAIRHNLVAECLTGQETDVHPIDYFPHFVGPINNLTPDYIHVSENLAHIIDFKTKDSDHGMGAAYANASLLYVHDAAERCLSFNGHIFYSGFIVSPSRVLSPFVLEDPDLLAIKAHYELGDQIFMTAKAQGLIIDSEEDTHAMTFSRSFNDSQQMLFDSLPSKQETLKDPFITKEMVNTWNSKSISNARIENEKTLKNLLMDAMKSMEKDARKNSDHDSSLSKAKFLKEWSSMDCRSSDNKKSFIQLPLFIPKVSPIEDRVLNLPFTMFSEGSLIESIWKRAIIEVEKADDKIFVKTEKDKEDETSRLIRLSKMEKKDYDIATSNKRRKRARIILKLSETEKAELALSGVFGKKFKDMDSIKIHKADSKKPFPPNAYTGDVDKFINIDGPNLMTGIREGWDLLTTKYKDIYDLGKQGARSMSAANPDFTRNAESFFTLFNQTTLGASLCVLDMILEEVNVSLKHHCEFNQFVVKKIPYANIYLLLKPLSAEKHVHFSILAFKNDFDVLSLPFKVATETEHFWITDFVSINRHRLSSLLGLSFKACCLYAMFCEIFNVDPMTEILDTEGSRIRTHFLFSLLVLLESKAQTSTCLQQIRYMYMKTLKFSKLHSNPLENLTKMDPRPKSRLLVWIYNKVLDNFYKMTINRPQIVTSKTTFETDRDQWEDESKLDDASGDKFLNLLSWVDGKEIHTYKIALNLSYLGVLHNKDDAEQIHGFLKIFEKVVKEELTLREANIENMGYSSLDSSALKDHEFNANHARICGFNIKDFIKRKRAFNSDSLFHSWIFRELSHKSKMTTIEEYATLKASAVIEHNGIYKMDSKFNQRCKCMEGVLKLLNSSGEEVIHPLSNVMEFYKICKRMGIKVNLFKKLQIGGSREIFVLTIESRLLINFLETLSRILCTELDIELLSKGDQKFTKNTEHFTKIAKMNSEKELKHVSCYDSDDATTWAQRFVMPVFGAMFNEILPNSLKYLIFSILNLVADKKLELPGMLLNLYHNPSNVQKWAYYKDSIDENPMNTLKKQHFGQTPENDLVDKNSVFLKNKSNMMQGILHFTSSLLHCGHLYTLKKFFSRITSHYKKELGESQLSLVTSFKVSSDDSSTIKTAFYENESNYGKIIWMLSLYSYVKAMSYPLITAKQSSEKSSPCIFKSVEEFNSYWTVSNTLVSPIIKFIYAATAPKIASGFDSRQITMANLRKQILENGGSHWISSVVSEAQARIHYVCLGMHLSPIFDKFIYELKGKPHPCLGLFVFEPELLNGLFGYDFALYLLIKCNPLSSYVEKHLLSQSEPTINELGKPTVSLHLFMGGAQKYKAFLKRIKIPEDWRSIAKPDRATGITRNYGMLLRPPKYKEEVKFWIHKKALTPGIQEAFSFETSSKMFAAGVYVLHSPSVAVRIKETKDDTTVEFMSLLGFMKSFSLQTSQLTPKDCILLFPLEVLYVDSIERLKHVHETCRKIPLENPLPRRFVTIKAPKNGILASRTLSDCCRRIWYGENLSGKTQISFSWNAYRAYFPWLQDSQEETLSSPDCPFKDVISLCDYIRSVSSKVSTYKELAPVRKGQPTMNTIESLIRRNHMPTCVLKETVRFKESEQSAHSLESRLKLLNTRLLLSIRLKMMYDRDRTKLIKKMLADSDIVLPNEENARIQTIESLTYSNKLLAYCVSIMKGNLTLAQTLKELKNKDFGFYPLSAKRIATGWKGPSIYNAVIDELVFQVNFRDNNIIGIQVNSMINLVKHMDEFKVHMSKFSNTKSGISEFDSQSIMWFHSDLNLVSPYCKSEYSIPIVLDKDLLFDYETLNNLGENIMFSEDGDKIYFEANLFNRDLRNPESMVKILKYQPNRLTYRSDSLRSNLSYDEKHDEVLTFLSNTYFPNDSLIAIPWCMNESIPVNDAVNYLVYSKEKLKIIDTIIENRMDFKSVPENDLIVAYRDERNTIKGRTLKRPDFLKTFHGSLIEMKKWLRQTFSARCSTYGIKSASIIPREILEQKEAEPYFTSEDEIGISDEIAELYKSLDDPGEDVLSDDAYEISMTMGDSLSRLSEDIFKAFEDEAPDAMEVMNEDAIQSKVSIINSSIVSSVEYNHVFWDDFIKACIKEAEVQGADLGNIIYGKSRFQSKEFQNVLNLVAWMTDYYDRPLISLERIEIKSTALEMEKGLIVVDEELTEELETVLPLVRTVSETDKHSSIYGSQN